MRSRGDVATVVVPAVVASVPMVWALGKDSFWFDEAVTALIVTDDAHRFVRQILTDEPTFALHHALLRIVTVVGSSEPALRAPSVLAALVAVVALGVLVKRLFGRAQAIAAGLLFGLNAFTVEYAREARCYALALMLTVGAAVALVHALDGRGRRRWVLFGLVAVAATAAHLLAAFAVAGQVIGVAAARRRRLPWRDMAAGGAVWAVLVLPLAAGVVFLQGTSRVSWIKPPSWAGAGDIFFNLSGGNLVFAAAAVAAAVAALRSCLRPTADPGDPSVWGRAMLLGWLATPVAALLVLSAGTPVFLDRYLIGIVPAACALVAVEVLAVRPRTLGVAVAGLLVASAGFVDLRIQTGDWSRPRRPDERWSWIVAELAEAGRPGDVIVYEADHLHLATDFYAGRSGRPMPRRVGLDDDAASDQQTRVWLVLGHVSDETERRARATFASHYKPSYERPFGAIDLLRYDPNPDQTPSDRRSP